MNIHGYKKKRKKIVNKVNNLQKKAVELVRKRDSLYDSKRFKESKELSEEIKTIDDLIEKLEGAKNRISTKISTIHAKREDKIFKRKQSMVNRLSGKKVKKHDITK